MGRLEVGEGKERGGDVSIPGLGHVGVAAASGGQSLCLGIRSPTLIRRQCRNQDVYEIPVKLIINGVEPVDLKVEVPSSELPPQLQIKIAHEVLSTWKKHLKKKAAPWGVAPTFEWVATNFAKLLMLDAECVHPYEGCDENDCSMRRYAIGPPAAPALEEEEEESEEDSEDEEDAETEAMRERLAALLHEVEHHGGYGGEERKKLTPEEIEQKKREAEELGEKCRILSKKERGELNKTRKEKAGHRLAKTGQKNRKYEGEGATSKEDKKKKNKENVKKRFGLS